MALCCSHAAAGYLAYEAIRPATGHRPGLLAAAIALANGPDLDYLPGLLIGQPGVYHRGVTHTVLAVVIVAAVVGIVARILDRRRAWVGAGLWAGAVWGSHLLVDWLTRDVVPPYGARFLWPLSDAHYQAPIALLPAIVIDSTSRATFVASLVAAHTVHVWMTEAAVLVLAIAAVHFLRSGQPGSAWRGAAERS